MNKSSISPACVQDLLDSATNAAGKGQAQWFTPRPWAQLLAKPLPRHRPAIVDLTCGRGDLLLGCSNKSTDARLGCDIDPGNVSGSVGKPAGESHDFSLTGSPAHPPTRLLIAEERFIRADVTALLPLLREVDFKADLFTLNPPWDLHWHRERLALLEKSSVPAVRAAWKATDPRLGKDTLDSTVATLMLALDCCSDVGEGFLIANAATMERLIISDTAPHRALRDHVWAVVTVDGNICDAKTVSGSVSRFPLTGSPAHPPTPFRTAILYFARGHLSGPKVRQHIEPPADGELATAAAGRGLDAVAAARWRREGSEIREYLCIGQSAVLWSGVRDEWLSRQAARTVPRYNIWLSGGGTIRTHLSVFDQHSVRIDKAAAAALHEMNGKRPMQLVLQRAQRDALQEAIGEKSPWSVDPSLAAAVAQAVRDYHSERAPLYPLPEIQRLGYLDEEDEIVCKQEMKDVSGSVSEPVSENNRSPAHRLTRSRSLFKPGRAYPITTRTVTVRRESERINLAGEAEDIEYTGAELCILITDESGRQWSFMEQRLRTDRIWILGLAREGRDDDPPSPPSGERAGVRGRRNHAEGVPAQDCIDFTLQELVAHFIIPAVPDVAAVNPAGYQANLQQLEEIEALCP